jgi:dTDP-4-amino-4,6-dideoxygalactose transaminase
MVGHNYRMTDLHAAIGLVQLAKLETPVARRATVAGWYG